MNQPQQPGQPHDPRNDSPQQLPPQTPAPQAKQLNHGRRKTFVENEMATGSAASWAKIQEKKRKQQKAAKRARRLATQQEELLTPAELAQVPQPQPSQPQPSQPQLPHPSRPCQTPTQPR